MTVTHDFFREGFSYLSAIALTAGRDIRRTSNRVRSRVVLRDGASRRMIQCLVFAASRASLLFMRIQRAAKYRAKVKRRFIRMSLYSRAREAGPVYSAGIGIDYLAALADEEVFWSAEENRPQDPEDGQRDWHGHHQGLVR